jgi:XTP/dITP diphosphohydrolase
MKLVIASNNTNKIREIRNKFADIEGLELVPLNDFPNSPEVIEDGNSFRENAHKKAVEIANYTGYPSMSDDSGLVVDALNGRPGIFSARYGGPSASDADRNRMIIDEMRNVSANQRTARFICVIAIAFPDGRSFFAEGACEGTITEIAKGANGFGYDPIFYLPGLGKTMAELNLDEKNRISHRAQALEAAKNLLLELSR